MGVLIEYLCKEYKNIALIVSVVRVREVYQTVGHNLSVVFAMNFGVANLQFVCPAKK